MNTLIEWFARHSKAANLLVIATMLGGFLAAYKLPKEIIPTIERNVITVSATLAGASADTIANDICSPLEKALLELNSQKNITAISEFGVCKISIELKDNSDNAKAINDITTLSSLIPLPEKASKPIVAQLKNSVMAIRLAVTGEANYDALLTQAKRITEELHALGIQKAKIIEAQSPTTVIEVEPKKLQALQMSLLEVANALQQYGITMPSGSFNNNQGTTSVAIKGGYLTTNLKNIVIRTLADGSQIQLGDIAHIKKRYSQQYARVNGKPAVAISIYQGNDNNIFLLSKQVHQLVTHENTTLPKATQLHIVFDNAQFFNDRMSYLKNNFLSGLIVGGILLILWLRLRMAFWITADIPIAFGGALIWLYLMGGSINMVSAFGFIIVLGIVCDDAIVIGENIHRHQHNGNPGLEGAIKGVTEVAPTVIFAVMTTIIMFVPLLFLPGAEGQLMRPLPMIIIAVLVASLVEALLVLPTHLSHQSHQPNQAQKTLGFAIADKMDAWVLSFYQPMLKKMITWRYVCVAACVSLFLISLSLVFSSRIPLHLLSNIQTEIATAAVTFPNGNNHTNTINAVNRIEQAAIDINQTIEKQYGSKPISLTRSFVANNANHGEVYININNQQSISNSQLLTLWKEKIGTINNAAELSISSSVNIDNTGFHITLSSDNKSELNKASKALLAQIHQYSGVITANNISENSQENLVIHLKDSAYALGLTSSVISAQVYLAISGTPTETINNETFTLQMPKNSFNTIAKLEQLPIQINATTTTPLINIANLSQETTNTRIVSSNGKLVAHILVQANPKLLSNSLLLTQLKKDFLETTLTTQFPSVSWEKTGSLAAESDIKHYLVESFIISLIVMFIFLAIFLNSYTQPLLIFTAIPYGIVGALLGHFIFNQELTLWSLAGMIAVSGIVVNNNMMIIFFINERLKAGHSLMETVLLAGIDRFRPIMLTTITTFTGVLPTILGNSWETQFLIPLAISIGCGVVFAALLTLFLVPCFYVIGDDVKQKRIHSS